MYLPFYATDHQNFQFDLFFTLSPLHLTPQIITKFAIFLEHPLR